MRLFRFACAAALMLSAVAARPLAAPARMISGAASKITIDGNVDEWPQLEPLDETHVSAAAQNDGRNLYLLIATSDQARRRQLLAAGVIVWLDADGGKKHNFGIRIPGMLFSGFAGGRRGPRNEMPPPPDFGEGRQVPSLSYVEIVGPGKDDRRRLELDAVRSIQAARSQTAGTLTLELQIPLQRNDASEHAIGARAGSVIGLGLETPKIERPEEPPPGPGGGGGHGGGMGGGMGGHGGCGGGRGGMGGGMGGGRGGGPRGGGGGERGEHADPMKYWTTVQLAGA